ncbi:MAG: ice-binding family protein [Bellilinea sp.]
MQKRMLLAISVMLVLSLSMAGVFTNVIASSLAATSPTLGAAGTYSVLAGETVTNTGPTIMPGNLGVSPGSAVTGFPPGTVGPPGTLHSADANAAQAQADSTAAFTSLDQSCDTTYPGTKDLAGENLVPGVYCADAFALSGVLTLSGSGVWIFKSAAALTTSSGSSVVGGDPCNVWWRVVSSATIGAGTSFIGNILALTSISLQTGASLNGRALAQTGAVTLDSNTITGSGCLAQEPTPSTETPAATSENTQATATLLPVVAGLPSTGGGPIRDGSSPWILVILIGASAVALFYGLRSMRRDYLSK